MANNSESVLGLLVQKIGSANWKQWQVQRFQWYDWVRVANTGALTTSLNFFSIPQGGADPVSSSIKTKEQTNMVKANTFGQQYFIVQQIRTQIRQLVKARQTANTIAGTTHSFDQLIMANRLRSVIGQGVLNFVIGQKAYFDIVQPYRRCPPGFGMGSDTVVVPFDRTVAPNGNAFVAQSNNLKDVYALTPPQLIEPEQTFQITIDFPQLGYNFAAVYVAAGENANVESGVILDGYLARPVQ